MNRQLIIAIAILFALKLTGQSTVGIGTGLSISMNSFINYDAIQTESRNGFFLEFNRAYKINESFKSNFRLRIDQKGFVGTSDSKVSDYRFTYFNFNPEVEYEIINKLSIAIGAYSGVGLQQAIHAPDGDWDNITKFDIIKDFDFGVTGKLKFDIRNVYAFVGYNMGLLNILNVRFTDVSGNEIADIKQFNRAIQLGLGYTLNFDKEK